MGAADGDGEEALKNPFSWGHEGIDMDPTTGRIHDDGHAGGFSGAYYDSEGSSFDEEEEEADSEYEELANVTAAELLYPEPEWDDIPNIEWKCDWMYNGKRLELRRVKIDK